MSITCLRYAIGVSAILWALVFVGIAQAAVIEGTGSGDVLNGTAYADKMYGHGGADTINAKSGRDLAEGGSGADTLDMGCGYDSPVGNGGEDLIYVDCADGKPDVVDCGSDVDIVFWRVPGTVIAANCENKFNVTNAADMKVGLGLLDAWLARHYMGWFSTYEEFGGP